MNIAFFDFDGTLTTGDGFLPFVRSVTPRPRRWAGNLCLSPLVLGYYLRWVAPRRLRQAISWFAFRGRPEQQLRELGARYALDALPALLRPQALERVRWHQAQGDVVVVVSASLDVYLAPWCREHGLELICTQLQARAGVCTGWYLDGDCSGEEKARRIRDRYDLARYAVVFAYGDTAEDAAMLELAQRRYFRWREVSPERREPAASPPPQPL